MAKKVWARVGVQFIIEDGQLHLEENLIDAIRATGVFTGDSYIPAGMYGNEENDKDLNIIVEGDVCDCHSKRAPKGHDPAVSNENRLLKILKDDILERYNDIEYWDPDIVRDFCIEHKNDITEEEASLARKIIGDCQE